MSELYDDLIDAGVAVDSHESDLYCQANEHARAILARYPMAKAIARTFINQAPPNVGQPWFDIPFAYAPFWRAKQERDGI